MNDSQYITPGAAKAAPFGHGAPIYNNIYQPLIGGKFSNANVLANQIKSVYGNFYPNNLAPSTRTPVGKPAQVW